MSALGKNVSLTILDKFDTLVSVLVLWICNRENRSYKRWRSMGHDSRAAGKCSTATLAEDDVTITCCGHKYILSF